MPINYYDLMDALRTKYGFEDRYQSQGYFLSMFNAPKGHQIIVTQTSEVHHCIKKPGQYTSNHGLQLYCDAINNGYCWLGKPML